MWVADTDWRPPTLLRPKPPSPLAIGAGFLTVVVVFGSVGAFLALVALFTFGRMIDEAEERRAAEEAPREVEFVEAKLVKLGREFDPRELPNRIRRAKSTGQQAPSEIPTKRRRRVSRPDDPAPSEAYEDLLRRIGSSIDREAAIASAAEQEGDPEGVPEGTATRDEGDLYRTRLYAFFRRGLNRPGTITDEELRGLSATVAITTDTAGIIVRYSLARPSGNQEFDQAVRLRMDQAVGSAIPAPPEDERDNYLSATFNIRVTPPR
jgi:hypothetical protein